MPYNLTNAPNDRTSFRLYCMRRLGYPVVKIEISDEQANDRVNDALLYFWDYHFEGCEKTFYKYQITATDITNRYITLPANIIGAVKMWEAGDAFNSTNIFNFRYQFSLNDLYPLTQGSILTYWMTLDYLTFLEQLFVGQQPIRYNRYDNIFYIDQDWTRFLPGQFLIIEAYQIVDPTTFTNAWSDRWLCRYATALIKRQWGSNLKKYTGTQILGGVTWNGQQIFDEADKEIEKLESEMNRDYGLPVMDQIG